MYEEITHSPTSNMLVAPACKRQGGRVASHPVHRRRAVRRRMTWRCACFTSTSTRRIVPSYPSRGRGAGGGLRGRCITLIKVVKPSRDAVQPAGLRENPVLNKNASRGEPTSKFQGSRTLGEPRTKKTRNQKTNHENTRREELGLGVP